MNKRVEYGIVAGCVLLLCGLLVGVPSSALATKSASKKSAAKSESHMTAGAPKELRTSFSRIGTRRIHGVNALHRSDPQRSVRRSLARNNSRSLSAQREELLDSSRIHLIDGDTFAYGAERIRIQGFNAAEGAEVGGLEATQRFDELLHQGHVTIIRKAIDIYGRTVAEVFVDHHNVADMLSNDVRDNR
jgi:endonuclease YncB( thermonuclease family)